MILFSIVIYIGTLVILVSFICAIKLRKKKKQFHYFSFFYWIPLMELLLSVNSIIALLMGRLMKNNLELSILQNIFHLAGFILVCFYFYIVFNKKPSQIIKLIFLITAVITGFLLSINIFNKTLYHVHAVPNLMIFLFCLYYYSELLKKDETSLDLFKLPEFWIVTGFFISTFIIFSLFSIIRYLRLSFGVDMFWIVITVTNLFIIIKQLFFIKAYLVAKEDNTLKKNESLLRPRVTKLNLDL